MNYTQIKLAPPLFPLSYIFPSLLVVISLIFVSMQALKHTLVSTKTLTLAVLCISRWQDTNRRFT